MIGCTIWVLSFFKRVPCIWTLLVDSKNIGWVFMKFVTGQIILKELKFQSNFISVTNAYFEIALTFSWKDLKAVWEKKDKIWRKRFSLLCHAQRNWKIATIIWKLIPFNKFYLKWSVFRNYKQVIFANSTLIIIASFIIPTSLISFLKSLSPRQMRQSIFSFW